MEFLNKYFQPHGINHVAMFARLFCFLTAFQTFWSFKHQLMYFKSKPHKVYEKGANLCGLFSIPTLCLNTFIITGLVFITSLVCISFNVFPTVSTLIALCAYFLYFTPIISLDTVQRKTNLLALVLLILLFSPYLSKPLTEPATTWELLLIKLALSQMYLSSGIQKLKNSGWKWGSGHTLQAYLLENYLWTDSIWALGLGKNLKACSSLSKLTLFFELTFWLVVIFPQLSPVYVVMALFFHVGTLLAMRINYLKYLSPVYCVFFTDFAFYVKDKLGI